MPSSEKLTLKEEAFCREFVINGGSGVNAYKKVYSADAKPQTAHGNATLILKKEKIKKFIEELKKPIKKKFEYTINKAFENLVNIQDKALNENNDLSNALKAEELKCKLLGFFKDGNIDIKNNIDTVVNINFLKKKN